MLAHNREELVPRAIRSILSQTFRDFEFIIVDNGSTDSSGEICDGFAAEDPRIRVIHRNCMGGGNIGSGRNVGLDAACGEYVAFIDDDDYAEPDFLEFLIGLAEEHDADIAVCGSNKEEDSVVSSNYIYVFDELYVMDALGATEKFLRRQLYNAAMPTKLVRKNLFNKVRFPNEGSYDDISTTYKYFANAGNVVAHGIPKYCFYRHPGNNSSSATKHHLLNPVQLGEYLEAFRERTEYISKELSPLTDLALYSEWSYMISMVEKIHRFELTNCDVPLAFMQDELRTHRDEFYNSVHIEQFEKDWMDRYIYLTH
jgi:glycosyltransferase involved in cell wall biosynthesis